MSRKRVHRPLKEELKDLFNVHAAERRGIGALLLLGFLASGWVVYEQYVAPDLVRDKAALEVDWAEMRTDSGSSIVRDQGSYRQRVDRDVVLFPFDPNHLPVDQWVALGLSERQAAAIHRYEEKGGRFRVKRDVAKMHVVDAELFERWEPYIQLPDSFARNDIASKDASRSSYSSTYQEAPGVAPHERRSVDRSVEINTADTNRLVEVRGIGPAFARGIVKYRDRLGGFYSLEQLSEVYILRDKPEAVEELKSRLLLDTLMVRRFPLNSFTAEELGPHPYAGWKVAKALVAYRKQHGPFKAVADIKGCVLVTDSIYRKLAPYLSAE